MTLQGQSSAPTARPRRSALALDAQNGHEKLAMVFLRIPRLRAWGQWALFHERTSMRRGIPVLILLVACVMTSCRTTRHTSDPEWVAKSFLRAVIEGKHEVAVAHVVPEHREEFLRTLQQGLPWTFPRKAEVTVFMKKNGDGKKAGANFHGGEQGHGVDMEFREDRWWVTK